MVFLCCYGTFLVVFLGLFLQLCFFGSVGSWTLRLDVLWLSGDEEAQIVHKDWEFQAKARLCFYCCFDFVSGALQKHQSTITLNGQNTKTCM